MDEIKDFDLFYLVCAKKFDDWIEKAYAANTSIFDEPETKDLLKAFSMVYPEPEVSDNKNVQRFFLTFCAGIKTALEMMLSIEEPQSSQNDSGCLT